MFRSFRALRTAAFGFLFALAVLNVACAAPLPAAPDAASSFEQGMLHVDVYGSGPRALILIPGLGSGAWAWYGTIAHFQNAYTIYAVTLAGFDGRPATRRASLFAAFSSDFWKMLEQRNIRDPIVIGHSLGATLAFALAEQRPERLHAIVAVDGLPIFPMAANQSPDQRTAMAAKLAAQYASLTPAQALVYETQFMQTIGTNDPSLVEPVARLEARSDAGAVAAWMKEDLETDLRPQLAKISIPVLVIAPYDPVAARAMGGFSAEQGRAFYASLVAGTPKVQIVTVEPARHFAMLDQPDAFYAQVTRFLDSPL